MHPRKGKDWVKGQHWKVLSQIGKGHGKRLLLSKLMGRLHPTSLRAVATPRWQRSCTLGWEI